MIFTALILKVTIYFIGGVPATWVEGRRYCASYFLAVRAVMVVEVVRFGCLKCYAIGSYQTSVHILQDVITGPKVCHCQIYTRKCLFFDTNRIKISLQVESLNTKRAVSNKTTKLNDLMFLMGLCVSVFVFTLRSNQVQTSWMTGYYNGFQEVHRTLHYEAVNITERG